MWEKAGPPDNAVNAVGAIGSNLRENENGDCLVILMQANEIG